MAHEAPSSAAVAVMTPFEKQLGRYLMDQGLVSKAQIQTVVEVAGDEGWTFLQALVHLKFVDAGLVRNLMTASNADLTRADLATLATLDGGPTQSSVPPLPPAAPGGTFIERPDPPSRPSATSSPPATAAGPKPAPGKGSSAVMELPKGGKASATMIERPPVGGAKKKRLGEYLLEDGVINQAQLGQALEYGKTNGVMLGMALVSLKFVDEDKLSEYILKQRNDLQKIVARSKKLRIGDILVEKGILDDRRLQDALAFAVANGMRLGEALVRRGFASDRDVAQALSEQLLIPYVNLGKSPPDPTIVARVPKRLCTKHKAIPYRQEGSVLTVAMVDPLNIIALDDFQSMTSMATIPVIVTAADFDNAVRDFLGGGGEADELLEILSGEEANEKYRTGVTGEFKIDGESAPIVKMVHKIIGAAYQKGASDVHIEPLDVYSLVRLRIDGVLRELMKVPREFHSAIVSRIKVMCQVDIAETRKPQDGKFRLKVGNATVDFRTSFCPLVTGEKAVIRLLDQSKARITIDSLGMEQTAYRNYYECLHGPHGIVLVCGPTGSGKTTTLYSGLLEINNPRVNIHTVEDPVEYSIPGITQVQIDPPVGRTFAACLKAFLRQDPDVILVGEIRDGETASIALKAAMTGHLVLSTLHTNNAVGAIDRLISMGVDRFLMASSIRLIVAQRLLRQLCAKCKERVTFGKEELARLSLSPFVLQEAGFADLPPTEWRTHRAVGCEGCQEGLIGRIGVHEVLRPDETFADLIVEGGSNAEMFAYAKEHLGMLDLMEAATVKCLQGDTCVDEVARLHLPQLSSERREKYRLKDAADEDEADPAALARRVVESQEQMRRVGDMMELLASRVGGGGVPSSALGPALTLLARVCREALADTGPGGRTRLRKLAYLLEELNDWFATSRPTTVRINPAVALKADILEKLGVLAATAGLVGDRPVDTAAITVTPSLEGVDRELELDWPAIRRCLRHLVVNALVAMPAGGQLRLGLRVAGDGGTLEVAVLDTGCGLAEDAVAEARKPFVTFHPEALGLGLALVERSVEAMGGRFELQSRPGRGTRATMVLPLRASGRDGS